MIYVLIAVAALGLIACLLMGLAICACLFYGKGRERRNLAVLSALFALLAAARLGGGLLLARFGLDWRCWVKGAFLLALCVLFLWAVGQAVRQMLQEWDGLPQALGELCGAVTAVSLVCFGLVAAAFGTWTDRVTEHQGQKAVEEDTGIFHVTGYRYVNAFVHGEILYEWED